MKPALWFPLILLAVGLALLVYMITVEGEPGALPLLLVVVGACWTGISLYRSRSRAS